jgi:cytochrome c-type biogenesis protein CcmH/NrfG
MAFLDVDVRRNSHGNRKGISGNESRFEVKASWRKSQVSSIVSAIALVAAVSAIGITIRARAFARPYLAYGTSGILALLCAMLVWQQQKYSAIGADPVSAGLSAGYMDFSARPAVAATAAPRTTPQSLPSVPVMIEQLETRLNAEPADAKGWSLLAKSYAYVGNDSGAESAISRAVLLGVEESTLRSQVAAVQGNR